MAAGAEADLRVRAAAAKQEPAGRENQRPLYAICLITHPENTTRTPFALFHSAAAMPWLGARLRRCGRGIPGKGDRQERFPQRPSASQPSCHNFADSGTLLFSLH